MIIMKRFQLFRQSVFSLFLSGLIFISGCDNDSYANNSTAEITEVPVVEPIKEPVPEIDNKNYLFDVSMHSIEELEALLARADEVSQTHPQDFEELEIVMIIHGPDIDWFTHKNYEHNQKLIDLAAKLDAYDVIDMKVCERTMQKRGVDHNDLPEFIEPVPYAPATMEELLNEGYINL